MNETMANKIKVKIEIKNNFELIQNNHGPEKISIIKSINPDKAKLEKAQEEVKREAEKEIIKLIGNKIE